jgi:prepilin-type N-terminal cleavage/methylation domain-containing protein
MNCIKTKIFRQNGFTLVEVIATILAVGILAAFFIHFMGTALDQSWKSVALVADEAETEGIVEEIIAYYTSEINRDPETALTIINNMNFGGNVTKTFIEFDSSGNEVVLSSGTTSNNLKVSVKSSDEDNPREIRVILTKSRNDPDDPAVNY